MALYKAGVKSELLNILYIENKSAKIAAKGNRQLSQRVEVQDVDISGILKCATTMDQFNKILLQQAQLKYKYENYPNIETGVLGMTDDTCAISRCGNTSVEKMLF